MRPYRKQRVANAVRHIVSEALVHGLNDPRVAPLTTITRVEVTSDLLIARIFLSVQGGETVERRTLAALKHATGHIQRMVARELSIRQCPALRFELDEVAKGTRRTMDLLAENRRRQPELFEPQEVQEGQPGAQADVHDPSDDARDGAFEGEGGTVDPIKRQNGVTEAGGDEA